MFVDDKIKVSKNRVNNSYEIIAYIVKKEKLREGIMSKAAIFMATGFEEIEAISIIDVLRRGGMELDIISVSGMEFIEGSHGVIVKCDQLFFMIDYAEYDMFILPGGMPGTMNLSKHEGLCELFKRECKAGKIIAAICAAPTVLGQIGILEGKMATCYPGFEEGLLGATVLDQNIVKDGTIITGRGAGVAMDFALELLKNDLSEEQIEALRNQLVMD